MSTSFKTPLRLVCALAMGTTLVACNSNKSNDAVRYGPQAVHPSPSALAQGTSPAHVTYENVAPAAPYVASSSANDGSRPLFP